MTEQLDGSMSEPPGQAAPWALDNALFTPAHVALLSKAGITPEFAHGLGVRSATSPADLPAGAPDRWRHQLPGLLFPWRDDTGHVEWQLRPDEPRAFEWADDAPKYLFRSEPEGFRSVQWSLRPPASQHAPVLFVEGTKQSIAAAQHAPGGMGVIGLIGCWGGSERGMPGRGLSVANGREVVVCLDADYASNPNVWDAGVRLQLALRAEGAADVKFLRLPASGTTGLDDVLGSRVDGDRGAYLGRLIETAAPETFADYRRPKLKVSAATGAAALFDPLDGFRTAAAAGVLLGQSPMALTREHSIAIYDGQVYRSGPNDAAFAGAVATLLGDRYRTAHTAAVRDSLYGALAGRVIPEKSETPLIAVANGLLDVTTGQLYAFSPEHLSLTQVPVVWPQDAEEAACPTYDAWLPAMIGADQVEGLEELAGQMLDPRRTPPRALMLFGPSRSGKSTFLRLLKAVAGTENTSAVTLHQLADSRFAAANVYGRILNVAADLSAAEVSDISVFKTMTGDDLILADRKHGRQFEFHNKALFAFSANTLPTVSEASRAYSERIRPVKFPHSFAGREDPAIEEAMLRELPGILLRWVVAAQRRRVRGMDVPVPERLRAEFEQRSNSVADWSARCTQTLLLRDPKSATPGTTTAFLYIAYSQWMISGGRKPLGRTKFAEIIRDMPDVHQYSNQVKVKMWNMITLPESEWDE